MIAVTIQLLIPLLGIASIEQAADYRVLITLLSYLPGIIIVLKRNMTMLVMTFLAYFMILFFNYLLFPTSHPFIESSAVYSLTPISLLTALFIVSIREPLIKSQLLLDKGYYTETEGKVIFNGKTYWRRRISDPMANEIIKELKEQYQKICDNGISISHIDSHQHIHTSPGFFFLLPRILKELHIERCRRIRNSQNSRFSRALRNMWTIPLIVNNIRTTDSFCSLLDYYNNMNGFPGETIELMVHPGHSGAVYRKEYELLKSIDITCLRGSLITYKEI